MKLGKYNQKIFLFLVDHHETAKFEVVDNIYIEADEKNKTIVIIQDYGT